MATSEEVREQGASPISGLVPMIRVRNIERSLELYRLLGFEVGNRVPARGPAEWVWLYAPGAADWRRGPNLMLSRSDGAIDPAAQQALFYLYAGDLPALRHELLARGVAAGEISYPAYLPEGELELIDPDGYHLMIAQSTPETP